MNNGLPSCTTSADAAIVVADDACPPPDLDKSLLRTFSVSSSSSDLDPSAFDAAVVVVLFTLPPGPGRHRRGKVTSTAFRGFADRFPNHPFFAECLLLLRAIDATTAARARGADLLSPSKQRNAERTGSGA